jgi:hypothetical protein
MDLALKTFNLIAKELRNLDGNIRSVQWLKNCPSLCASGTEDIKGNKAWHALSDFFEVSYWDRVWIFQEVALAKKVFILHGNESLDFKDLDSLCPFSG